MILVVDDEESIVEVVRSYLMREGFQVATAHSGSDALSKARSLNPDLVILDLMLPDIHGEEVARMLRTDSDIPIIMLTAKSGQEDRIAGLSIGADDYVVKPFSPRELILRINNILRRSRQAPEKASLSFDNGYLIIDRELKAVSLNGIELELTPSEYKLLLSLAEYPGRPFSRAELISRVQGYDFPGFDRVVDAHVKNLRRKLNEDGREATYVQTVYGVGYRFGGKKDG